MLSKRLFVIILLLLLELCHTVVLASITGCLANVHDYHLIFLLLLALISKKTKNKAKQKNHFFLAQNCQSLLNFYVQGKQKL
jgi:hypothetical protein